MEREWDGIGECWGAVLGEGLLGKGPEVRMCFQGLHVVDRTGTEDACKSDKRSCERSSVLGM